MNPPRYSGSGVEVRGAMAVIAAARPLDAELRSATIRPWASTGARWRISAAFNLDRRLEGTCAYSSSRHISELRPPIGSQH